MTPILIVATLIFGPPSLYLAVRSRDVRKFLAGAFFVSSGIQFYLFLMQLSVPIMGTNFVQTPELSSVRSSIHFVGFLLCFYFGFIRKPKSSST